MAGANSPVPSITRRVGDCRSEFEVERSLEPPSAVLVWLAPERFVRNELST